MRTKNVLIKSVFTFLYKKRNSRRFNLRLLFLRGMFEKILVEFNFNESDSRISVKTENRPLVSVPLCDPCVTLYHIFSAFSRLFQWFLTVPCILMEDFYIPIYQKISFLKSNALLLLNENLLLCIRTY